MRNPFKVLPGFLAFLLVGLLTFSEVNAQSNWQLLSTNNGVELYAEVVTCAGASNASYALKFVNTNSTDYAVDYQIINPDDPTVGPLNGRIDNLEANSSVEGNCTNNQHPHYLLSTFGQPNLSNLKITFSAVKL